MNEQKVLTGWVILGVVIGVVLAISHRESFDNGGFSIDPTASAHRLGQYLGDAFFFVTVGAIIVSPVGLPLWLVARKRRAHAAAPASI